MPRPDLDALFDTLRDAPAAALARQAETAIWERWMESDDPQVEMWMAKGLRAMGQQDYRAAIEAFDQIVRAAPDFAEGWNKRATVNWLLGDHEASLGDIDRTLALEPRHFGALSGMAMIHEAHGRVFDALDALERIQVIYPCLPHLSERVQQLIRGLAEAT